MIYYAPDELKSKEYVIASGTQNIELATAAWWSSHGIAYDALEALSRSTSLVDGGAHPPAFLALQAAMRADRVAVVVEPNEAGRKRQPIPAPGVC